VHAVSSGGERLGDIRKRGRAAFDKRIGCVLAHLLGLTSCTLRLKRLKAEEDKRDSTSSTQNQRARVSSKGELY
jgi:hypothetical protein